ncbi:MAG: hypothetical protein ACE5LB_07755 [Acidiferrobacterales bacterium]
MSTLIRLLLCSSTLLLLLACTGESREPGDHVWNTQTKALEKAREVEQLLQTEVDKKKQLIDAQSP